MKPSAIQACSLHFPSSIPPVPHDVLCVHLVRVKHDELAERWIVALPPVRLLSVGQHTMAVPCSTIKTTSLFKLPWIRPVFSCVLAPAKGHATEQQGPLASATRHAALPALIMLALSILITFDARLRVIQAPPKRAACQSASQVHPEAALGDLLGSRMTRAMEQQHLVLRVIQAGTYFGFAVGPRLQAIDPPEASMVCQLLANPLAACVILQVLLRLLHMGDAGDQEPPRDPGGPTHIYIYIYISQVV